MSRTTRVGASSDPAARELIVATEAEIEELYGRALVTAPEDFSPPRGAYLTIWEDGRAVAGGGLWALDDATCELKRMYVLPDVRGSGAGRTLLEALEAHARALGYGLVRLDTGALQPRAQRMYERAGYRAIPAYNDNPVAAFWAEKQL